MRIGVLGQSKWCRCSSKNGGSSESKLSLFLLNIKLNLDGQGRQPPAVTAQPPATSRMSPAAFTPPSTAAFTLEG